jgi:two-component system LytT family response regulator
MKPLHALIIDDEEDARVNLRVLMETFCPEVQIVGEADSMVSGYRLLKSTPTDILFLDIQMQDGTGFDLLDKIANPKFKLIFTTAFDDFALKAFRYSAVDYLLKPIDPDDLIRVVERLQSEQVQSTSKGQLNQLSQSIQSQTFEKIALPSGEGLVFLNLTEIINLESEGNYTTFFTTNQGKVVISQTLKEFEKVLPKDQFFRTHQSHLINVRFVKKFLKEDGGYALLENGKKIPVSRRKKDDFLTMLSKQFNFFGKS